MCVEFLITLFEIVKEKNILVNIFIFRIFKFKIIKKI
jgi:hypothetical protein